MSNKRPVLPPLPDALKKADKAEVKSDDAGTSTTQSFGLSRATSLTKSVRGRLGATTADDKVVESSQKPEPAEAVSKPSKPSKPSKASQSSQPSQPSTAAGRGRQARLRLTHIDPWSVMKMAFLLSIALGIVWIVAVAIIWGVMGAAGVWDSINSTVGQSVGSEGGGFDITKYLGTSRVVGFTMLAAVADVILLTAIATLAAFLYNLGATLLGGVEVTLTEDR